MLSFPSLEHLLVVQRWWDNGVQSVGSHPAHGLSSFLQVLRPQGSKQCHQPAQLGQPQPSRCSQEGGMGGREESSRECSLVLLVGLWGGGMSCRKRERLLEG